MRLVVNLPMKNQKMYEYKCIDGNWTKHPVAFCTRYSGVLTKGLMKTHRCEERNCPRLKRGVEFE